MREGNYGLDFYAWDRRGNRGSAHRTLFIDDADPPDITSVDLPSCNRFHRGDTVRITGHFNEDVNRIHAWIEGTAVDSEYGIEDSRSHTISVTVPSSAGYDWYTAKFRVRDTGNN